jgi:hypothetical protein
MLSTLRGGPIRIAILFAWCVVCWPASSAATPFHNLGFEFAVIDTPVNNEVPSSDAIPNWNIYSYDPGWVLYDQMSAGSYCVSIHDGKGGIFDFNPLQGQYSLLLQTQFGPTNIDAWISQTGDIPAGINSIMFLCDTVSPPIVSLNGTVIPTSIYSVGPTVNASHGPVDTYVGDIRAFSGQQNVELRFESNGFNTLDGIRFSTVVVPEPTTLALLAIGAIGVLALVLRQPFGDQVALDGSQVVRGVRARQGIAHVPIPAPESNLAVGSPGPQAGVGWQGWKYQEEPRSPWPRLHSGTSGGARIDASGRWSRCSRRARSGRPVSNEVCPSVGSPVGQKPDAPTTGADTGKLPQFVEPRNRLVES